LRPTLENDMSIADIKKNTESKMNQSLAALGQHLSKIRTGRANPSLLDSVMVDYYGNPYREDLVFGVHIDLERELQKRGLYAEWVNPGRLAVYEG